MQIIMVDATKEQVKYDDVQTPRQEKDLHLMRVDADVIVLPEYNKPKKTNNAQIIPQGETSTIGT